MTENRRKLLDDARSAGFTITHDNSGTTFILKTIGRWGKQIGIILYDDGTAFRADVPLGIAAGMRSYDDMRKSLGIK